MKEFFSYCSIFYSLARGKFLVLPIFMLLAGLFDGIGIVLFFPLLERLQDETIPQGNMEGLTGVLQTIGGSTLQGMLLAIVCVFLFKFVFLFFQEVALQKITRDLYRSVALNIIHGWSDAEYKDFYLKHSAGKFVNLLTRELWTFLGAFQHYAGVFVGVIYVTIYLVLSLLLDVTVTTIAFVAGVALLIVFRRFTRKTKHYSLQVAKEDEQFQGGVIEFMQSYKYLKATNRFPKMNQYLERIIMKSTDLRFKMGIIGSFIGSAPEPIAVLLVAVFIYVEVAIFGKAFGLIAVLILLFYRTLMRIVTLQSSWQKFFGCSGALKVIPEALEQARLAKEQTGTSQVNRFYNAIQFEHVSFAYDTKSVLSSMNLQFRKHTTIALVGPSGTGKSTVVDLLTGVLKPTSGRITIDGKPYTDIDLQTLRHHIGYVTQEIVMFRDTIINNISFWDKLPKEQALSKVVSQCVRAFCRDFIERLPDTYETNVGDRGINVSVGQRQRIAIARELYRDPEILIFDEATSALDSESEQYIQKSIEALKGSKTMILIAHRLSTIKNADYIYVLDQGQVIEEGTFDDLYGNQQSKFYGMCKMQSFT